MLMPTQISVLVSHAEPMVHRGIVATLSEDTRFQVHQQVASDADWQDIDFQRGVAARVLVTSLVAGIEAAKALRQASAIRRSSPASVLVVAPVDSEMSVRGALQAGGGFRLPTAALRASAPRRSCVGPCEGPAKPGPVCRGAVGGGHAPGATYTPRGRCSGFDGGRPVQQGYCGGTQHLCRNGQGAHQGVASEARRCDQDRGRRCRQAP